MISTPSKVVAFVFALTAFALAIVAGMFIGDDAEDVLKRAIVVLFVCYLIGLFMGSMVSHVVNEFLRRYETDRPVPEVPPRVVKPPSSGTGGSGSGSS